MDAQKQLCWQFGRKARERVRQRVSETQWWSGGGLADGLQRSGRKVASAMLEHAICSLCLFYAAPFHLFTHSEIIMKNKMLASTQAAVTNNEKT